MPSKGPQVVEQFGNGIPHPHEFDCETKVELPIHYIETTCGYSGFAKVVDGVPVCPNCEATKKQFLDTQDSIIESEKSGDAVHELVSAAVARQLGPLQDTIAQLTARLDAKNKETVANPRNNPKPANTQSNIPDKDGE